jgi:hypothetical protein
MIMNMDLREKYHRSFSTYSSQVQYLSILAAIILIPNKELRINPAHI